MELHSRRVVIRPWQRRDEDLADQWPSYGDPFESIWNLPRTASTDDSWGGRLEIGAARRSWAVENEAGRLIGRISLREIDERRGQARLGVTFGAPFVGQGLGTDALVLFLNYFFSDLGFQTMVLDVAAPNKRAVRCYRRLGFRHVGSDWRLASVFFDSSVLQDPRYMDLRSHFRYVLRGLEVEFLEMQITRIEWLTRRQ